ncbi:four-carbon acid sugar kinase family protein [Occultella aeris]|uniref:Four-carbon acid sugar kinase family protein n=1 Tax=Occultella aeris TaxID=2761496 RepID=A0A7M4DHX0_9MICO|nr:four-carbon acid sugar kinase family protein [Occultella aeris]VZO36517.1 hypothetical protein HALOF300_01721 [Occultella aeris]
MRPAHVWADDLTGAAEFARLWQSGTGRDVHVRLGRPDPTTPAASADEDTVWDLDLRHHDDAEALRVVTTALAATDSAATVFLKLDSRLRGPVRAYVSAVLQAGRPVLLCPANPAMGRLTVAGRHGDAGTYTSAQTDTDNFSPVSLTELGSGLAHRHLGRTDYDLIPPLLSRGDPILLTVDISTAADLDRLAAAGARHPHATFAGSAPFLGALARTVRDPAPEASEAPVRSALVATGPAPVRALLAVLGTSEHISRVQVDALAARDKLTQIVLPAEGTDPDAMAVAVRRARAGLARGEHVILTFPVTGAATQRERAGMDALVSACAGALTGAPPDVALLLSGGHTARLVLERLDLRDLRSAPSAVTPVARLYAPDGRTIWTKPGSYGGAGILLDLLQPTAASLA